ncbi:hypothetical protein [Candidatus Leptofilum sp.]|uniref:hypothetical protein n=1 Tax=Candidatus Leptofilum sp. TaxID=3241576 RepID=UPI003B5AEF9F
MNKVIPRKHLRQGQLGLYAGLLLILLLLTACFGGSEEAAPPEGAVQRTGTLTCSQSCLSQGQCGAAADGRTVILAHSGQPTFRDHNAILENESAILIAGEQIRNITNANGTLGTLTFYAVQPTGGGPNNWVAGSCVNLNQ